MAVHRLSSTRVRLRPWLRDAHVLLALAIAACALGLELLTDPASVPTLLLPVIANLVVQVLGHHLAGGQTRTGLDTARLLVAVGTVLWMSIAVEGAVPLSMLYIPIVTMGAAMGWRPALVVGAAAVAATVILALVLRAALPPGFIEASGADPTMTAAQRGVTMIATMVVLAIGTRRTVGSLERAIQRARSATAQSRRQARQIAAVEEVGRVLASSGPTSDALERVMDVLHGRFGYRFASIYTVDGTYTVEGALMRLRAQRGYQEVIESFDGSLGVVGRVMRTGRAELIVDVHSDPDYASADPSVRSEVSVPLTNGDAVIGVLNVESDETRQLDASDRHTLILVADRVASALALARERQALEDRAAVFGRLIRFGTAIDADLGSEAVRSAVVRSIAEVLDTSSVTLVVRDIASGEDRIAAMHQGDMRYLGARIMPGEGMSGRAIAERRVVTHEGMTRADLPSTVQGSVIPDIFAAAAVPLLHDERVIGAIAVTRTDTDRPFTPLEMETLEIIASQVATTLVNAALHDQLAEAAIRDPLTGLWNRRQLDVGLTRLFATRDRMEPDARRPVAAILFDLDHFGAFNKRHGHSVGDQVLQAFGRILNDRVRSSDLLARYGGEEFIAVLDGATIDEATRVADEIRRRLEAVVFEGIDSTELRATVSAGCAALGPNVASFDALLELTDVALQMAKRGGRNQVVAA
jgi:diguanylate cyclase (GGDEF)-like protein